MSRDRADYIAIVRQLLAKAERTDHPEEADAYTGKALDLMAEHAIDNAMLDQHDRDDHLVESIRILCKPPYAETKARLVGAVAVASNCRAVRIRLPDEPTRIVAVFGYQVDLDQVTTLSASLQIQAKRQLEAQPRSSRSFRHSFLHGFAQRVGERLTEARHQAEQAYEQKHDTDEGSVALVLAQRHGAVDEAVAAAYPDMQKARATTVGSSEGAEAGYLAGDRADLGGPRLRTHPTVTERSG